jgi:hypothetical protein
MPNSDYMTSFFKPFKGTGARGRVQNLTKIALMSHFLRSEAVKVKNILEKLYSLEISAKSLNIALQLLFIKKYRG